MKRKRIKTSPVFICKSTGEGDLLRSDVEQILTVDNKIHKLITKYHPYVKVWGEKKLLHNVEEIAMYRKHGFTVDFETTEG